MDKLIQNEVLQTPAIHNSRKIIRSLKAKADTKRTHYQKLADWMIKTFGSVWFLLLNFFWFSTWILINTGRISGIVPFDPFPFGLLTMIVSLEAIILAIFVLISQNRTGQIDDLREEIDLQVDIITERELTKLMEMVSILMKKNNIDMSKDEDLNEMLKPIDVYKIEKALERQINQKN